MWFLAVGLHWTGHVIRMEGHRIPKQRLYRELCEGIRKTGRPKLRYKDTIRSNLKWPCVKLRGVETLAADRETWSAGGPWTTVEPQHLNCLQAAREKPHRAALCQLLAQDHHCPTCGRYCVSGFGLQSHLMRFHNSHDLLRFPMLQK